MSHNLQDTTIHGLYYLARSKSRTNIAFWSIVTTVGLLYASFEIVMEVRSTLGRSQFNVQYHTVEEDLQKYPVLGIYFSDWTQTVDWEKAEMLADEMNLSSAEYALWFSGMHRHTWEYNSTREEKISLMEKLSFHGNWSLEASGSNESDINDIWIIFSQYFEQFVNIYSICLPTAKKLSFDVRHIYRQGIFGTCRNQSFDYHSDFHKQMIRFQLMNYSADLGSNPKTRFLLDQYAHKQKPSSVKFFIFHSRVREWHTTDITDGVDEYNIEVKPMLTNYPTYQSVQCKHYLENFTEIGYKCFEWQYSVSISSSSRYEEGHNVFSTDIKSTKKSDDMYRNITLNIIFPPRQQWVMREYKPKFQLYAFVAKIGGTLGLWTGASIVSFVHLVKLLLFSLVSRCAIDKETV